MRPETAGFSSARLARLDEVMTRRYVEGGYLPGMLIHIYRKGQLVHTTLSGHIDLERHDVDPRHHHVGGGLLVQLHDIAEDRPLLRIEGLLLVLLDQLLERSAQVLLAHTLAA